MKTAHMMLKNHYFETRDKEAADKAIDMLEKLRESKKPD